MLFAKKKTKQNMSDTNYITYTHGLLNETYQDTKRLRDMSWAGTVKNKVDQYVVTYLPYMQNPYQNPGSNTWRLKSF